MDVRTQMRSAARYHAGRTAIVAGERRLSFAEAWTRGVRLANTLLALGLEPQDRVGVLEDNCLESADFFLGAASRAADGFGRAGYFRPSYGLSR